MFWNISTMLRKDCRLYLWEMYCTWIFQIHVFHISSLIAKLQKSIKCTQMRWFVLKRSNIKFNLYTKTLGIIIVIAKVYNLMNLVKKYFKGSIQKRKWIFPSGVTIWISFNIICFLFFSNWSRKNIG